MFASRAQQGFAVLVAVLLTGCARELPLQPRPTNGTTPTAMDSTAALIALPAPGDASVVPGEYLVMLRQVAGKGAGSRIARDVSAVTMKAGVVPQRTYSTVLAGFAARMTESQVTLLAKDPRVLSIEPNRYVQADAQSVPWGITTVKATLAHSGNVRGAGVKVGVIDTGIDYTHPDLAANYAGGYDFVNQDNDPMDDNGHGTHVSGTIAAVDNSEGVIGVAPSVRLYGIKVLGANGSGSFADVIAGIDWAAANGMKVVNLSLGAGSGAAALQAAVDNAFAAGVVVVAAAGNSGGRVGYPGAYASCICVSAVQSNNTIASFSCRGPEVDVTAPGVGVSSTYQGGYASLSGTSMATPHVAGVAALVWGTGRYATAALVRSRVISTATDIGTRGVDQLFGYGLVNAGAAIALPPNKLPKAYAGGSYTTTVGRSVSFSSAGSSDPDGQIVGWSWSFGDGATSTLQNPTHVYTRAATFTVKLMVTDDRGGTAQARASARIKPAPPDTVTIVRSDYTASTKTLVVVGTSTNGGATLKVTSQGNMTYDPQAQQWTLTKSIARGPTRVEVTSTKKGKASARVTVR